MYRAGKAWKRLPGGGGGGTCPVPTHRESAAGSTDDFYRHKLQSVIFIHLFYLSANGGEGRGFDVLDYTFYYYRILKFRF